MGRLGLRRSRQLRVLAAGSAAVALIAILVAFANGRKYAPTSIVAALSASGLIVVIEYVFDRAVLTRSRSLRRFFGQDLIEGQAIFAYPDFDVRSRALRFAQLNRPPDPDGRVDDRPYQIKFDRALALEDTLALNYVAELIPSTDDGRHLVINDRECVHRYSNRSFFSFGLGSNDCTFLYLERFGANALFERTSSTRNTDAIDVVETLEVSVAVGGTPQPKWAETVSRELTLQDETSQDGSHSSDDDEEAIRVLVGNSELVSRAEVVKRFDLADNYGPHDPVFVSRRGDSSYGLILRCRPCRVTAPQQRWVICGGSGAEGTVLAAHFLAREWKSLYRSVRRNADFLAIVTCAPGAPKSSQLVGLWQTAD